MMRADVNTLLVDLPGTIKAFVAKDTDDFYTIYLNSRLSHEQNLVSFIHEMEHIENDDFYSDLTADQIERVRHGKQ